MGTRQRNGRNKRKRNDLRTKFNRGANSLLMAKIQRSTSKGKKFMVTTPDGKKVHFGASGMRIKAGTSAGDSYCARSAGIKSSGKYSPNALSRKMWGCVGTKSYADKAKKLGDNI